MNNFKNPQYLTPKGFTRTAKKPMHRILSTAFTPAFATSAGTSSTAKAPTRLRELAEKRVMAKRILQRQNEGISEETAKIIAEAIKTLLHS
jgi:hypothetical protein